MSAPSYLKPVWWGPAPNLPLMDMYPVYIVDCGVFLQTFGIVFVVVGLLDVGGMLVVCRYEWVNGAWVLIKME